MTMMSEATAIWQFKAREEMDDRRGKISDTKGNIEVRGVDSEIKWSVGQEEISTVSFK